MSSYARNSVEPVDYECQHEQATSKEKRKQNNYNTENSVKRLKLKPHEFKVH